MTKGVTSFSVVSIAKSVRITKVDILLFRKKIKQLIDKCGLISS